MEQIGSNVAGGRNARNVDRHLWQRLPTLLLLLLLRRHIHSPCDCQSRLDHLAELIYVYDRAKLSRRGERDPSNRWSFFSKARFFRPVSLRSSIPSWSTVASIRLQLGSLGRFKLHRSRLSRISSNFFAGQRKGGAILIWTFWKFRYILLEKITFLRRWRVSNLAYHWDIRPDFA